jgi:phosphatidylserine/phosphatidylglycerophosphate/cardiolipin synthase-like enzyme
MCGTHVRMAVRDDGYSDTFTDAMVRDSRGVPEDALRIHRADRLHEKGLLSDHYYLRGSFNFTHNGLRSNEEAATLHTSPQEIAEAMMAYAQRWGRYD